jgi:hypothetical protein
VAKTYCECLIEADTEDQAYQIAHSIDPFDTLEETESYEIQDFDELKDSQIELYDMPTLQQTKEGYKVKE